MLAFRAHHAPGGRLARVGQAAPRLLRFAAPLRVTATHQPAQGSSRQQGPLAAVSIHPGGPAL